METQRSLANTLFDRSTAWFLGFPPEKCSYVTQALRIPVSTGLDKFELAADLYKPVLPEQQKPAGTILVRGPYGRGLPLAAFTCRPFAARGYQVLFVSCRGTFGSGGEFDAFRNEETDGQAVVTWMRQQPWYTGTFATLGMSYLGFVQWALLRDPPPDMVAAVMQVTPHDFSHFYWGTGTFTLEMINWGDMVVHQEQRSFLSSVLRKRLFGDDGIRSVVDSVPLLDAVERHFKDQAPWMEHSLSHPDISDDRYESMQHGAAIQRADIPILLVSGWYDLFLTQTMEQYAQLEQRGRNVALTVGPWAHSGAFGKMTMEHSLEWLERHVAGRKEAERKAAVQYYVTGVEEWRSAPKWPPQTKPHELHLQPGHGLSAEIPTSTLKDASSTFTFDPRNPTPTIGGNLLNNAGRYEDSALASRSDVLTFTSEPLTQNLEFAGDTSVTLFYSSTSPYIDFFVRISEVNAKGQSYNLIEGFQRIKNTSQATETGEEVQQIELKLYARAHRFLKGTRVRVIVAGGSHPQYLRNSGTEESVVTGSEMRDVNYVIYHSREKPSRVRFPRVSSK
ncbi:CocE/NonD hydrolase [Lophiostoma macrostomum CBS 122681]|uniref:CocE/NonD hydrolase n=1 Tax=Lophiostoma macrostomum CBS 122681 TaxID=1314788 RepID=A0A6A6T2S8_9PLEO|nr:CocE/NonD hydrolase [Lophiostoma macrostomum CBS 122681]